MMTTSVEFTASAYSLNASSTPAATSPAPAAAPAAGTKKEGEANARKSS